MEKDSGWQSYLVSQETNRYVHLVELNARFGEYMTCYNVHNPVDRPRIPHITKKKTGPCL